MKNVHEIEIKLTTEWEKCLYDAFKKKVKETKVDGFRKGACPKNVFIKRFGIESLYMDAVDEAVAVGYKKALEDNKDINPVSYQLKCLYGKRYGSVINNVLSLIFRFFRYS